MSVKVLLPYLFLPNKERHSAGRNSSPGRDWGLSRTVPSGMIRSGAQGAPKSTREAGPGGWSAVGEKKIE